MNENQNAINKRHGDIERLNRINFRPILQAISRPGSLHSIEFHDNSGILATAMLLLYPSIYFYSNIDISWDLIAAVTGASQGGSNTADYLFCREPCLKEIEVAKTGDTENPEKASTLLIEVNNFSSGVDVQLSGPGIKNMKQCTLPISKELITARAEKNKSFPMGIDLFFLSSKKEIMGLPRTTKVEIL